MIRVMVCFLITACDSAGRVVVQKCHNQFCASLAVEQQKVWFRESKNFVDPYVVGPYLKHAQQFVPADEAPIAEAFTSNGWRAVVSASLPQYDAQGAIIRLRIMRSGKVRATYDGNYFLDR